MMARSRSLISGIALAIALGTAAPAQAQLAGASSGYSDAPRESSNSDFFAALNRVGSCLANSKQEQSEAFVGAVVDSQAEADAFGVLFNRDRNRRTSCMGRIVSATTTRAYYRGAVAEGLFEDLPEETVIAFIANPPSPPETIRTMHDFASCYVASYPDTAQRFLRETRAGTEGELEFVVEIFEDFGPCLPVGRGVSIDPTDARFAIAEAAWRAATGRPSATIQGRN